MSITQVIVPGKIMLAGEYATLFGGHALASTVSAELSVQIQLNNHINGIEVSSNIWPENKLITKDSNTEDMLSQLVQHAMQVFNLNHATLEVDSELDPTYGLGSSSALRLAIFMAFNEQADNSLKKNKEELIRLSFEHQKAEQKTASGYDIATQSIGGILKIRSAEHNTKWPKNASKYKKEIDLNKDFHIFVGGKGAPTKKIMQETLQWIKTADLQKDLIDQSEQLISSISNFLLHVGSIDEVIKQFKDHRKLFRYSPHFPSHVEYVLKDIPGYDRNWSFKTTGAGGEDALLFVGTLDPEIERSLDSIGWYKLPYSFTHQEPRLESLVN